MRLNSIGILAFILMAAYTSRGQPQDGSILQKRVTLRVQERPIASILEIISDQAGVYFSYDASLIDSEKEISLKANNKTIDEILQEIIGADNFQFKELKNHIIIAFREPEVFISDPVKKTSLVENTFIYSGKIIDRKTKEPIHSVNISLNKKPVGTISNQDGDFILKLNTSFDQDTILFSCIGYALKLMPLLELKNQTTISLDPISIRIKEVRVTAVTPEEIIRKIIENIPQNYGNEPMMMTSFYRETVRQDENYINVSEAVMEILKSPYLKITREDKVRIIKGRKSPDVKSFKWINFKLQGGPYTITKLDVIKTMETFLDSEFKDYYKYEIKDVIWYKNHPAFIIGFKPLKNVGFPCFNGEMIVDRETFALMQASFTFGRPALNLVGKSMVKKKPTGVKVRPIALKYKVEYAYYSGKWFLNTASALLEFKVRSREDKINSIYESVSDLLVTDIKKTNLKRFPKEEVFSFKDIFSETIINYDEEFWENFNTIKPTEDLKNAIRNFRLENGQSVDSLNNFNERYMTQFHF